MLIQNVNLKLFWRSFCQKTTIKYFVFKFYFFGQLYVMEFENWMTYACKLFSEKNVIDFSTINELKCPVEFVFKQF